MEVTDETRFKRYLHYVSEEGIYSPGDRFYLKRFTPERFTSLPRLIFDGKEKYVIECINKVYYEKSSPYPEAIVFAIAQCVSNNKLPSLREAAYKLAETICTSPEHFFLFFKFAFEKKPRCGSGRACRRLVKNWYLKKSALELAEIVTQKPKFRGWRHSDLLSLAHISCKDPAKAAVLKYASSGLEEANKAYGSIPEAEEVLSYLRTVADFRKLTDSQAAARKIESYTLSIDNVNFNLLKDKEVWTALLRNMPLEVLLKHFQWLSKNSMFRNNSTWDYEFVKSVCDALGNPTTVADSGLHPSRILIELTSYKSAARVKLELASKLHMKPSKQPPVLNSDLIKAFDKVIRSSFKSVATTGLSYTVAIDVTELMQSQRCGHCKYMTASLAASLITLCLVKAEKSVEVLTFSQSASQSAMLGVTIPPTSTVEECQEILHQAPCGPVDVRNMFAWAIGENKKADVFIVLTTFVKHLTTLGAELNKYIDAVGAPNARLILCNLCGTPKQQTILEAPNVLIVSGFDDKVCSIMEAFARGAF